MTVLGQQLNVCNRVKGSRLKKDHHIHIEKETRKLEKCGLVGLDSGCIFKAIYKSLYETLQWHQTGLLTF